MTDDGRRTRRWAAWMLAAYSLLLGVLALSARASDVGLPQLAEAILIQAHRLAALSWLRFGHLEAGANILLFIPVGFLLAALLGRRRSTRGGLPLWVVWLVASSLSAGIELIQGSMLSQRNATVRDVLCNSTGALIGICVALLLRAVAARSRSRSQEDTRDGGYA